MFFNEKTEKDFFYFTEKDLIENKQNYQNKPFAYIFYSLMKSNNLLSNFDVSKVQNFFNKIDFSSGTIEIRFSDNSILVIRNGVFYVSQESSGYFNSFSSIT